MVSRRSIDVEYVPATDSEFVRRAARAVRMVGRDGRGHAEAVERELRRTFPYAAVLVTPLSVGPGAAAAAAAAWRVYRDGGQSQSMW